MNHKQHACIFYLPSPSWKGVLFEVTNKCNLLCKHCCNASSAQQEHVLDTRTILDAVSAIVHWNASFVYLSGGEPLTRPDIFQIIQNMKSQGLRVAIATNGTLLDVENSCRLAESGVDYINFSLDSLDEHTHDQLRGKRGAHRLAVDGIRRCIEQELDVRVTSVLTPFNCDSLEDFVLFLIGLEVRRVVFSPIQPLGRIQSNPEWVLPTERLEALRRDIEHLGRRNTHRIEISHRIRSNTERKPLEACPGGKNQLHITADGDVYPCSWLAKCPDRHTFFLGNIKDAPIERIQQHGLQIYEALKSRGSQIEMCQTCDKYELCNYGCPLFSMYNDCGLTGLDPICPRVLNVLTV